MFFFDERFLESTVFLTKTPFFTKVFLFFFAFYWWYGKHLRMFCFLKTKTSLLKRHESFLGGSMLDFECGILRFLLFST